MLMLCNLNVCKLYFAFLNVIGTSFQTWMFDYYDYQVLVQLGDILDRGQNELAILSLLKSLSIQAKSVGGAVFQAGLMKFKIMGFNRFHEGM